LSFAAASQSRSISVCFSIGRFIRDMIWQIPPMADLAKSLFEAKFRQFRFLTEFGTLAVLQREI
jgi:hypothetical protein